MSLDHGVAPFRLSTTIVEPGFFRTELQEKASKTWPALSIPDYAERTAQTIPSWERMNGKQMGDPAKLARALISLLDAPAPPERWVAGADAVTAVEQKARTLLAQIDAHRDLSTSLAHDDVAAPAASA